MSTESFGPFDRGLPRKRMAAGMLLFDAACRVLLVKPIYRECWDTPGGMVELDESPRLAARREVQAELGLDRTPGALLCVDWVPRRPDRSEGLVTIFDGGVLGPEEIDQIRLQSHALSSHRFVGPTKAGELLPPLLCRRLIACKTALAKGQPAYLENGLPF